MGDVLAWGEFAEARPDLAEAGRGLFYQFGVGLGFLATVRPDGGPRVHPMCPLIVGGGLYGLIEPSGPKRRDLDRDGRYAMHCFPPADTEDAFYVTGRAVARTEAALYEEVTSAFWAERGQQERPPEAEGQVLYEFLVATCLLTRTTGHGDWNPQHTIWHANRD